MIKKTESEIEHLILVEEELQSEVGRLYLFCPWIIAAAEYYVSGSLSHGAIGTMLGLSACYFAKKLDTFNVVRREMTPQKAATTNRFKIALSSLVPGGQIVPRVLDKNHRLYKENLARMAQYDC